MKKLFCFFIVVAALGGWKARADRVTGLAVVVTDSVITEGEVNADIYKVTPALRIRYGNDPARYNQELDKIRDQVIEQKVENKLILHEFLSGGYVTNLVEAFIDDDIRRTIQKAPYFGDRVKFLQTLRGMGMTYEMYRRQQRELIIIKAMSSQNVSDLRKIIISPLNIEQYYQGHKADFKVEDQVKVRMIVIPQSDDDPPGTAKRIAQEILDKVNSGVSFEEMARVNSAGTQRAEAGDRGWVDRSYLNADLTKVAFSLKPGLCSGVIEQPKACYILKVDDVRSAHIEDLKDVRAKIEQDLTMEQNRRLHDIWIQRLKNKSWVKFY